MWLFKSRIKLITDKWELIESFKSNYKPSVGEFIYSGNKQQYYMVKQVIHSVKDGLVLVVTPIILEKKEKKT